MQTENIVEIDIDSGPSYLYNSAGVYQDEKSCVVAIPSKNKILLLFFNTSAKSCNINQMQNHIQQEQIILDDTIVSLSLSKPHERILIAVALENGKILTYDSLSKKPISSYPSEFKHNRARKLQPTVIQFANSNIYVGQMNGDIYEFQYDLTNLKNLMSHQTFITALEHNDTKLASADAKGNIVLWDIKHSRKLCMFHNYDSMEYPCFSLSWLNVDKFIAGYANGVVRVLDFSNGKIETQIDCHRRPVCSVACNKENGCFLSASEDGFLNIYQIDSSNSGITCNSSTELKSRLICNSIWIHDFILTIAYDVPSVFLIPTG